MTTTVKTTSTKKTAQNRGPVTTSFAPSTSCLATTTTGTSTTSTGVYLKVGHWDGGESGGCYPTGTVPRSDFNWDFYYYSPAACPIGWQTAASLTSIISGPAMGPGTSGFLCCPSGYASKANALRDHQCSRTLTSGYVLTSVYTDGDSTRTARNLTLSAATTVNCDGIPVVWATTDVAVLKLIGSTELIPASLSSLLTSSTDSSTPATTTSADTGINGSTSTGGAVPSTGTPIVSGSNSSLGTGAKAGIAIGAVLIAALVAVGIFLCLRRRKYAKVQPGTRSETNGSSHEMIGAEALPGVYTDNKNPSELPADEAVHELTNTEVAPKYERSQAQVYEMGPSYPRDAPDASIDYTANSLLPVAATGSGATSKDPAVVDPKA